MALRFIFPVLIALAMLFAPFAMQSGSAMAAPADHHGQAMAKSHCGDQSGDGKLHKSGGKPCCAAMCVAIAVDPSPPAEPLAFGTSLHRPVLVRAGPHFLAKLPTPPPRLA